MPENHSIKMQEYKYSVAAAPAKKLEKTCRDSKTRG